MNIASLFQIVATLAWLAAVGVLILAVVRAARNRPLHKSGILIGGLFAAAVVMTTVSSGLVFIQPEERGVVISAVAPKGYREQALEPGLRWIIPFAETVKLYPISMQTYTMSIAQTEGTIQGDDSIAARTSDGQEIYVDASIIYKINPDEVVRVHINWQNRYTDDLVRAQARGIIRDTVSQFGVEELISSRRFEMVDLIRESLAKKFIENGLVLQDFVLRNIAFSTEYAQSVEQKQIAEQQAQQAKLVIEQKKAEAEQMRETAKGQKDAAITKAEGEAQARIIEAQAETEALQMIAEALKGRPELLTYQYISKLSPTVQTMLLPSDSPFIIPLPTTTPGETSPQ
jgi:regulator of protease activity HflC (stomatin/prohibitin superfamily)